MKMKNANLKIKQSVFGEKTKKMLNEWIDYESLGSVGMGLFEVPPVIERGEGSYLFDCDGKQYLDFLSGFSVSAFGNNNEEINEKITNQSKKLTHYFDFPHPERIKLAHKLCDISGIEDKTSVIFGVTGSDAIELAVRMARYYTGKPYILTAHGDYHGVTYGTMGLTTKGGMQPNFHPIRPNMDVGYFPFPHSYRKPTDKYPGYDLNSLRIFQQMLEGKETVYTDGLNGINNVAAILVEPFQSSAGYYIPPKQYLQILRDIADRHGMLLIVDEIQNGLGRSGKMWAYEHSGIQPDIICTSKALGGGLPISAVIGRKEILSEWGPGAYVSTQAGNALACAAGNIVIDKLNSKEFMKKVNQRGKQLFKGLKELQKKYPIIGFIDNCGLYTGIELVRDRKTKQPADIESNYVRDLCVNHGLLFEKGGYYHNRMQLIPPLNVEPEVIEKCIEILDDVFNQTKRKFQ
jgi:4-aminobutyrate aminotransferase-like enzyme